MLERVEVAYELLKKLYPEYSKSIIERYKITDEERTKQKNHLVYGVQIIKTEYRDKIGVEQSKAEHLTNNESEINNMLNILKENEVTPVGLDDVIIEIKKLQALAKNKKLSYNT